jgi:hypothetical protein
VVAQCSATSPTAHIKQSQHPLESHAWTTSPS